jgi:hypothetical protein
MGAKAMLKDVGIEAIVILKTDANAAIGVASRRGMGKIRHIEVNQLWLQDKVSKKEVKVVKIKGDENPADHLTKFLSQNGIKQHMDWIGQRYVKGRHRLMPEY